ncbi:MAG: dihydroorotate dehydrogenase-like protein [Candidatus Marinimicrobia bacterium]|nr:dihydroorotate dehydrogenase-like protein [Candidatus Neomarinimicrobiota bacterium]
MKLSTKYMGMDLKNPLIVSASPLSRNIDTVKKLEDAGAPAVVMYSLFEEEIYHEDGELDHYLSHGSDSFAESLSYFPDHHDFSAGPDEYLNQIRQLKEAVDIPIIASLNGVSEGGWIEKAKMMEDAGADALELNVYHLPTDINESGTHVKQVHLDILSCVKEKVNIPVAVKLGHYFSALPAFARRMEEAGADALVMFNRFYQPDIDLKKLEVKSALHLSTSDEVLLPLRWIAVLCGQVDMSLAATSGVHTAEDVLKLTMAGADVTMMASALLKFGPEHITKILKDIETWMDENEYESLTQMRGSMSMKNVPDPGSFMRANYIKMLQDYQVTV